jgi:hypothetical protein
MTIKTWPDTEAFYDSRRLRPGRAVGEWRGTGFASIALLPVVVDGPGRYVTRRGENVVVDSVDAGPSGRPSRRQFSCRGSYPCGTAERWHRSGRLYLGTECDNDIVGRAGAPEGART